MPSSAVSRRSRRVSEHPTMRSVAVALIAKLRVAMGFTCGAFVLWLADPTARTIVVGTSIAVVGELLRVWAAGHLNKSREVTASGPYRGVSQPLYVGSSMMVSGFAVSSGGGFVQAGD